MTIKKELVFAGLLSCTGIGIEAHGQSVARPERPGGKVILQAFGNFHSGFGAENDDRGFELERCYLGYHCQVSDKLEFKAVMDVGKSDDVDDLHRIAYIKNAQVVWKTGSMVLNGGLIPTTNFKVQEDFWGYRYVKAVFQDYYRFASSADLGLSASYRLAGWAVADAIVVNGEGYKRIQRNDGLLYGLGVTLMPVEGLTVRLYGSINGKSDKSLSNTTLCAAFAGYRCGNMSAGLEYNRIWNKDNVGGLNMEGLSAYGTVRLSSAVSGFARYDNLWQENRTDINGGEAVYMAGVEYRPCRNVRIAPNFRYHDAKSPAVKDKYMLYVSCSFGL